MLDYIAGLVLLGMGFLRPMQGASVLGDETAAVREASETATPAPRLKLLQPVLTKEQEDAFQKDRKAREARIRAVTDARIRGINDGFRKKLETRESEDNTRSQAFAKKVNAFTNTERRKKFLVFETRFRGLVHGTLTSMEQKLASMSALLDRLSVAAVALKAQGKDIHVVDSDITAAQAKVTTALTLTENLAGSLSSSVSVTGESTAGSDAQKAVSDAKTQLTTLYTAFTDARTAVGVAVSDMEALTKPVEASPTP